MTRWDVRPVLPATAGRLWIGPTREGRPRMPVWASPGRGLQAAHPALCQSLKRQILAWKKSRRPRRTKTVVVVVLGKMTNGSSVKIISIGSLVVLEKVDVDLMVVVLDAPSPEIAGAVVEVDILDELICKVDIIVAVVVVEVVDSTR